MKQINQNRRNQLKTKLSIFDRIAFGLFSTAFLLLTVIGIMGSWKNIFWWVYSSGFGSAFVVITYFRISRKASNWSKIIVTSGFLLLFPLFSLSQIITYQSAAQNLASIETTEYFTNLFGRDYNYTELYEWENVKLRWNDSVSMTFYLDPIKIFEYGQARCGGYAILYAALCASQGYETRVVCNIFGDHAWTELKLNGTWTRVDSSPTGATMSDNIGFPLFYEERWNRPPVLALAFESSSIADVTSNYRSDKWSLLSVSTAIYAAIGVWFAFCIWAIWRAFFSTRALKSKLNASLF